MNWRRFMSPSSGAPGPFVRPLPRRAAICVECAGPIRRPLTVVAAERKGMHPLCIGIAQMKAYMLITGSGPIVILTSHDSVVDAALIKKLASKGIEKFIATRFRSVLLKNAMV